MYFMVFNYVPSIHFSDVITLLIKYSYCFIFISLPSIIWCCLSYGREAAFSDLEAYIYKVKNRISEEEDALKEVRRRDTESETEKRKYMRTCLHISTYMQIRTNRHVHVHTHTRRSVQRSSGRRSWTLVTRPKIGSMMEAELLTCQNSRRSTTQSGKYCDWSTYIVLYFIVLNCIELYYIS